MGHGANATAPHFVLFRLHGQVPRGVQVWRVAGGTAWTTLYKEMARVDAVAAPEAAAATVMQKAIRGKQTRAKSLVDVAF